jgi:PLD-like domain
MSEVPMSLVWSPGGSYVRAFEDALDGATRFVWVTSFFSSAGVDLMIRPMRSVLERGCRGRVVVAIDRAGINTVAAFEALLRLKDDYELFELHAALQGHALLHAKALFAEGPLGHRLVVGSANLTELGLSKHHELGLSWRGVPPETKADFERFVNSIPASPFLGSKDPNVLEFLQARGRPRAANKPPIESGPLQLPLDEIMGRFPEPAALESSPDEHVLAWVHRGHTVGKGRRALDALVLRVPMESLIHQGIVKRVARVAISESAHETRSTGYGIDLVPTAEAEKIRRDARRQSLLIAKLTLRLPCFGLWMPESYWTAFEEARERLQDSSAIAPERVRKLATDHRSALEGGGLAREVANVVKRLDESGLLVPGKAAQAESLLLLRFRHELKLRTPDVLASCIEFRTARQTVTPSASDETPLRQLLVDVIQAAFASTYRTGAWPRRFRSLAAKAVAEAIEEKFARAKRPVDGEVAWELLQQAMTWEDSRRSLVEVVTEFRKLVPDELPFTPPAVEELTGVGDDEEEGDDDGV